jgi:hypothetical protein
LLLGVPGIACVLGYTVAVEIGDIPRFPSPPKLSGYTVWDPRRFESLHTLHHEEPRNGVLLPSARPSAFRADAGDDGKRAQTIAVDGGRVSIEGT